MAALFNEITSGYFQTFSNLTPEQEKCRQFTSSNMSDLLQARQRDKFINEVRVCVAGLGTADEEEPLEDANFSQYQFYQPFIEDLVYFEEKFDFLVKCVGVGVCRVQPGFEERYTHSLLKVLTFRDSAPSAAAPLQILDLMQPTTPRTIAEDPGSPEKQQERLDEYRSKRRTFANNLRDELSQLESEQRQCETERRAAAHPMAKEGPVEWGDKGVLPEGDDQVGGAPRTIAAEEPSPVDAEEDIDADEHQGEDTDVVGGGVRTMVTAKEMLKKRGQQEKLKDENQLRRAKEEEGKKQKDAEHKLQQQQEAEDAAAHRQMEADARPKEEETREQVVAGVRATLNAKDRFKARGEEQKAREEAEEANEVLGKDSREGGEQTATLVTATNGELISTPYLDLLSSFSKSPPKAAQA